MFKAVTEQSEFAVKRLSKLRINTDPSGNQLSQLESEVKCQRKCSSSPFVVKYEGSFKDAKYYYLVSEFVSGGSLESLQSKMQKRGGFSDDQIQFISAQLVLVLSHIHRKKIIYRYQPTTDLVT